MASYYWCTNHHRVETDGDKCPAQDVLGPYSTQREAASAIERIREREERIREEDARWEGR